MRVARWILVGAVLGGVAIAIIAMVVALASNPTSDITDLEVGDCFDLDPEADGSVGLVDVVDCDESHNAEVVAVDELNPDGDQPYPDDDALFALAEARCADVPPDPRFGVLAVAPTLATWEARAGRVVCVALVYGDEEVTGRYGTPDA
ncbi:MAG: septum formation family protein [Ilumatobacter sp.]|nr:septum formation family protein [Ilumatobacter sp.]